MVSALDTTHISQLAGGILPSAPHSTFVVYQKDVPVAARAVNPFSADIPNTIRRYVQWIFMGDAALRQSGHVAEHMRRPEDWLARQRETHCRWLLKSRQSTLLQF